MNKILLDTNVLIWLAFKENLSKFQLQRLTETPIIYVSSLSLLEIRLKQELGKLHNFNGLEASEQMGLAILPFDELSAQAYQLHNPNNTDPFDNALVSIAIKHKLAFLTSDRRILALKKKGLHCIDARQ